MRARMIILSVASTLIVASLSVQAADQDPFVGSWKENRAKSTYDPPATNPNPAEVKIEAAASGYKITNVGGAAYTVSTLDGKDYPLDPATGSTTSWLRIDANTTISFNKLKDGTVVRMQRATVSKDGKIEHVDRVGYATDANGKRTAYYQDVIYEKQ